MIAHLHDLSTGRDGRQRLTITFNGDFAEQFDALHDDVVEVTIKKYRKKRSLDANAYCWVLIDKLAAALKVKPAEVYREAIRNVGGVSDTVMVPIKAVEPLCRSWEAKGVGWQTETFPNRTYPDKLMNVRLYYGSSTYDSDQMSRLIDIIVSECKQFGIDTDIPYTKEE